MSAIVYKKRVGRSETDFLPLQGTDYVELYVGNAKQSAHYYISAFGFQAIAYAGPETGIMDRCSYAVRQHKLTFVLTTAIRPGNAIADHVYRHGDGVKHLALLVEDATDAWEQTTARGAESYVEPHTIQDTDGPVAISGIKILRRHRAFIY